MEEDSTLAPSAVVEGHQTPLLNLHNLGCGVAMEVADSTDSGLEEGYCIGHAEVGRQRSMGQTCLLVGFEIL